MGISLAGKISPVFITILNIYILSVTKCKLSVFLTINTKKQISISHTKDRFPFSLE